MSNNFVQEGSILTFVAPSGGVSSGDGFVVENTFAVALHDAAEGADVSGQVTGVWTLPKLTGTSQSFASGAVVSFDISAAKACVPASGNYPIGVATAAAGTSATTVPVRLDGIATAAAS